MTELDELKAKWEQHDRELEKDVQLSRELLSAAKLRPAESAMRRQAIYAVLEAAMWLVIAIALGKFTADHIRTTWLAVSAIAVDLMSLGMFNALIQRVIRTSHIDYSRPIAAIQKQVETVRILRIRTTQWGALGGTLLWVPCLAVVLQAAFGLNIYRSANTPWLLVNVLFGAAVFATAIWVSKKYGDRVHRSPFLQRLMKDLDGNNLTAAQGFLASLKEFDALADNS
jgi:hypothetical protein